MKPKNRNYKSPPKALLIRQKRFQLINYPNSLFVHWFPPPTALTYIGTYHKYANEPGIRTPVWSSRKEEKRARMNMHGPHFKGQIYPSPQVRAGGAGGGRVTCQAPARPACLCHNPPGIPKWQMSWRLSVIRGVGGDRRLRRWKVVVITGKMVGRNGCVYVHNDGKGEGHVVDVTDSW